MLMERELTINNSVCGRWFVSLIALLLMSVGMQAEDTSTTYTFNGMSAASGADYQYEVTSTSGGASKTWKIKNFSATDESYYNRSTSGYVLQTESLGMSNIFATSNSGTIIDFQLVSDFTVSGSFVSAEITYSTSSMSQSKAVVYKVGDTSYSMLTDPSSPLGTSPATISLASYYEDEKNFNDQKIALGFTFTTNRYDGNNGAFSIQSVKITTTPITDYNLWVGGVQVNSGNAWNVLSDDGTPTVVFDSSTNTLTLNEATINGPIISNVNSAITIHLIGTSTITTTANQMPIQSNLSTKQNLTFTAEEGAMLLTNKSRTDGNAVICSGFNFSSEQDIPEGYRLSWDANEICSLAEYYDIYFYTFVNNSQYFQPYYVTAANCDRLMGTYNETSNQWDNNTIAVSYNYSQKTLTLNNAIFESAEPYNTTYFLNCDGYKAETLTINLLGENKFIQNSSEPGAKFASMNVYEGKFIITTDADNPGSLTSVDLYSEDSEYFNFINGDVEYRNGLEYSYAGDGIRYIQAASESYDLWVSGVRVTVANAANVLGDDLSEEGSVATVSFDATTNTLTLNGAYIYNNGTIVSDLENLTVFLVGENGLYGGTGFTFNKTSAVEETTVTFTTDGESNGSLFINNLEKYLFGEGVTPVYDNVFMKHEGDSHYIDCLLGVRVGGVEVTPFNKDDVLDDGTVSYDEANHILTLDNATIDNVGPDGEPMEACGIDYSGTADLTICLKGENTINGTGGCEAIRFNGYGEEAPKLIFTKGDNLTCSLQLSGDADYVTAAISGGFSEIEGVWGLGATDNGLAIIADNEVKYDSQEGLTIKQVVNYTANYVPLSSTQIASYYGLTVSGVPVYEGNKDNITGEGIYGDGTASFEPETNTLTLENVNLNPDYAQSDGDLRVSIVTSLAQLNINLIGESQTYAIKTTNEDCQLTFTSAEEDRGAARLNFWYNAEPYFIGFGEDKVIYNDGLCLRENWYNSSFPMIVALYVPQIVTDEKERGLYYTDHVFTFALEEEVEGFDIYYANQLGGDPVKTTDGTFTLGTGRYVLSVYPIYPGMDTDPSRNWQYSKEIYVKVIDKPTFSVDAASVYNDDITVFLENIPEQGTTTAWDDNLNEEVGMPQVWYYIDDNKTDSVRYDATKGIPVTESCKVSAYILDEDSGRVVKSAPVEAEYTIKAKTQLNISYAGNSREWASYCASENSLETPDGLQAYVVKQATKTGVEVEQIDYIPQGGAVLLKRTGEVAEPIVAKAYIGDEPEAPANELVGTTTSTPVRTLNGSVYVLYNDGFTRATSGSIGANRGYLLFDDAVVVGARLSIFEDETTAVENLNRETITDNHYYNLNGQRVAAPKKNGLYIVNGQKVVK